MNDSENKYGGVHSLPIKSGGNAFPIVCTHEEQDVSGTTRRMVLSVDPGLSVHTYYAAHAPEIPEWFEGPAVPAPERPSVEEFLDDDRIFRMIHDFRMGDTDELWREIKTNHSLRKWYDLEVAHNKQLETLKAIRAEKRFFAWRWHYADQMIQGQHK